MAQSSDNRDENIEAPQKRVAIPERHLQGTEDSGLCPVQPGLQSTFEREDLAPEIAETSYDLSQVKYVSPYATAEEHASAMPEPEKRVRWCVPTRKKLRVLCSLLVLLVIIGAVVGGVVGSRSNHTWVITKLQTRSHP